MVFAGFDSQPTHQIKEKNMITYNQIQNEDSYLNDRGSCTVVATAIACQVPFIEAQKCLSKLGRRKNHGFPFIKHFRSIASNFNYIADCYTPITVNGIIHYRNRKGLKITNKPLNRLTSLTINNAPKLLPEIGTFVLNVDGHVATLRDGIIEDWSRGSKRQVYALYKFDKIQKKKNKPSKISSGYDFSKFI